MKNKFMAAAAVISLMTATGVAHAQTADVGTLKQQAAALKKQNEALELRLNKLEKQQAAQAAVQPAPSSFMAADLSSLKGVLPSCALPVPDGPLTFCGITIFGTLDAGLGYASSGLPSNSKFYLGDNLVNQRATHSYFGISPNGLSTTVLGIKGAQDLGFFDLSGVFWASTNINPQSGQLANAPGSLIDQNGVNRNNWSNGNDGSRGGQAFNDQLYVGVASKQFGQLTFGRHVALSGDLTGAYDPAKSNAYSLIGYSGSYGAGNGFTENVRWDNSFKYRVEYGPFRAGAMYKFADGTSGNNIGTNGATCITATTGTNCVASSLVGSRNFSSQNDAGQINLGVSYWGFDVDGVLGYFNQATNVTALNSAQLGGISTFTSSHFVGNVAQTTTSFGNANANTLAATVADTSGGLLAAKYTWNQFKFYAGWSHQIYQNPSNNVGVGAQNDQGGYTLSSVNNAAFPHAKLLDVFWVGARYAFDPKTDFAVGYYHGQQNGYGFAAGAPGVTSFGTGATGPASNSSLATCSAPAYISNVNGATFATPAGVRTYAYQSAPRSATCSGQINVVSGYVDYHFTKRFDIYGGLMYSVVTGGLASGYFNPNNVAPTIGARFTF